MGAWISSSGDPKVLVDKMTTDLHVTVSVDQNPANDLPPRAAAMPAQPPRYSSPARLHPETGRQQDASG